MKNPLLKLSVIAASLLLASTSGFAANYKGDYKGEAAPCPACQPILVLKDGFYVGAQVGYDSYRIRQTMTLVDPDGDVFATNPVLNATGWVGGLFAGYGQYFNNMWYLAGEVFFNGSNAQVNPTIVATTDVADTDSMSSKFTVNGSWGVALLPGIKLNDSSLFYIRLGYNQANLKGRTTFTGDGVTVSSRKSNWQGGFNYGLGLETAIYPNVSLRGEYSHTNYNSFSNAFTKFASSDNQYMLGLIYHFA